MRFNIFFSCLVIIFLCFFTHSQTVTFNFTGSVQTWTVPAGVTSVNLTVAGAKGGGSNGGNGAVITKNCFSVTPGQVLNIYVGGMGTQGANSGGWNGGGTGHTTATVAYRSWGGGGASDIRIGGTALANRVIVAGGGGGRGGGSSPVCGGAANCNNGAAGCSTFGIAGGGGTQTAGGVGGTPWAGTPPGGSPGTLGQGGQGGFWQTASGGGGGGGLYGGGGGGNDGCCTGANGGGGGGAGSSLVPAGGTCLAAGNANNGYVTITVSTLPGITATNTGPYCPGQTIQLNATGGGTYSWAGPNGFSSTLQNPTIPNMTAVNAGTYTVTVTNSGCSSSATTTVTLNTGATVNLTPSNTACASATNGSINVVATGSTPGYNVSWTGSASGNPAGIEIAASGGNYNIQNLGIGTYTVTVTANNLCATTATTTIAANPGVTGSGTFVAPLCNGSTDGSITVTANQGIAPYQVSWTGPTSGNPVGNEISVANGTYQITAATAGSYTITITDAAGCIFTFPISVTQPASLSATSTMTAVLCNGGTTGTFTGTATGGTAPYNMSWVGPVNGDPVGNEIATSGGSYTVNNAPQGSYTITITDANSCIATTNIQVTQPLPLSTSALNTAALCNNSADGTITVTATDGTAPYNVAWTGPINGNPAGNEILNSGGNYTIIGATAGTYNISVTDANGCTAQTTSTITQPIALNASATNTAALCNGSADGTITVTATDGTAAYSVSWTGPVNGDPAGNEIATSGGNYTITGVSAGTYTITVTDANGCVTTTTSTITEPTTVTASATNTAVLCNGGSTGSVTGIASGGTAPYDMSWVGPNTGDPVGDEITNDGGSYTVNGAPAGTYTITMTDGNGCVATTTTQIIEPIGLTASALNTAVLCNGGSSGSVEGTAIGGTAPYNMSWTGPNTGDPVGDEINTDGGSYIVNGAPAGLYTITMTDANGCTATATTTVIEPLVLGASAVSTPAICNGSADGTITVTATDGTAPYNVSWTGQSTGDPIGDEITGSGGNYLISALDPGNYTITVTDANGCTTQTTSTVTQPVALSASTTNTSALCNGSADGTITVTATDGTAAYSVSWTGPVNGDPAGNEITTSGGNYTITGVSAGTYNITVTDANGCTTTTTSTITEPTSVNASATNATVLCNGGATGTVTGSASGGTAPYDMSWVGPNTGDPAGDEITNDGGSYTVNGAPAGSYSITMTDANGCTATTTTNVLEPSALNASALNSAVLCNGGSSGTVQGTATGGTAPYNMSWTGPSTGNPAGDEITTDGGSFTVSGTPAGLYSITMTDANGCIATTTTNVIEPTVLQINAAPVPPLCNGVFNGSINVTAIGGTEPYDVSWTGPNSDDPIGTEISNDGGAYIILGVGAGTYTVTLTDANGCVSSTSVTLVPPAALSIASQTTNVLCNGGNNGSIQVTANNGTPGYNVSWSGTATGDPTGIEINSSGGNFSITNLISGSYTVFVTDINGCIDSTVVQISEPIALSQQNITTPALCSTSLDGAVSITVSGGIAPYNLELNGSTLANPPGDEINSSGGSYTFSNLAIGNYTITITDDNSCTLTASISIVTNNNPPVVTMLNDTICNGQSATLTPVVFPTGGTFLWGNASSGSTLTVSPTSTTQYAVLYNYSGCLAQASAFVVVNPIPTITLANETICAGESVTIGALTALPAGGTYSWSTNSSNQTITVNPSSNSNYSVTYTVNGCSSAPATSSVTVNPVPSVTINNSTICIGETATLTATPNIPGGSISWTPTNETTLTIDVSPTITSSYSAIYTVNGCSSNSTSASVTVNLIPQISFNSNIFEGCSPLSVELWNTSQDASLSTFTEWTIDNGPTYNGDTINPILNAGCHDITLSMTVNGCTGSISYDDFICVESIPVASFFSNISSFSESSQAIELINQSIGATSYIWNMGDGTLYTTNDVSHLYNQTSSGQTIWLTAISDLGCIDSTSINIPFEDAIIYYVPNSFTPDGDEFNNTFMPVFSSGIDIYTFEMSIFNRWGEVIFFSNNPNIGWDGSYGLKGLDAQSGVYTFKITFKTPQKDDRQTITGHINLLR